MLLASRASLCRAIGYDARDDDIVRTLIDLTMWHSTYSVQPVYISRLSQSSVAHQHPSPIFVSDFPLQLVEDANGQITRRTSYKTFLIHCASASFELNYSA